MLHLRGDPVPSPESCDLQQVTPLREQRTKLRKNCTFIGGAESKDGFRAN